MVTITGKAAKRFLEEIKNIKYSPKKAKFLKECMELYNKHSGCRRCKELEEDLARQAAQTKKFGDELQYYKKQKQNIL